MEAKALAAASSIDKALTKDEALQSAILATELYMKAIKRASTDHDRITLRNKCKELLTLAEEIKKCDIWPPPKNSGGISKPPVSERSITRTEEIILLEGSKLHGFIFPPWTTDPDDSFFADGDDSYTEPRDLELSIAQREIFAGWKRPNETFAAPSANSENNFQVSMTAINEIDLVQDITTDCSVVASLCAGTARALKGHGTLLASTIYPHDKSNFHPRISKNGKYVFRLNFNGCFRKVTIDDRLPASRTSRNLHVIDRRNPQLLWPALIEKAYLKVRGGYDFPGSNSGTDLWVMTGWIPEQVFLQSEDILLEQLWIRIFKSFGFGDVMITLGTGKMAGREERELGLAGEHDYAVLDMKELGARHLLLIKNPWCDGMIWKGARHISEDLSEGKNWTGELRDALLTSSSTTPGTFWMSFEDVVQHFESLYLNWNPGLFRNRQDHHFSWTIPSIKSPGSFTHNPQYTMKSNNKGTVWVLLSRHFATGEQDIVKNKSMSLADASSALGYISLYVFEADGRRVYLSDDAFHRGAFVDSPQTLARLEISPSTPYTIVVDQHGLPLPKYSYTLSFFSRSPLVISQASDPLPHCTTNTGSWNLRTAGGNASAATYPINPQFSISIPSTTDITLVLETDKDELAVHVTVVWAGGGRVTAVTSRDILGGSGDYRRGCALASLRNVAAGRYTIVCSTFEVGQLGNFTLRAWSMVPCEIKAVLAEDAGRLSLRLPALVLQDGVDRMLAPVTITRMTKLRVVVRYRTSDRSGQMARSRPLLKVSLERGQGPNKRILDISGNGEFSDAHMGIRTADLDLGPDMNHLGGVWIVVERIGGRFGVDCMDVEVLSDSPVSVGIWGTGEG